MTDKALRPSQNERVEDDKHRSPVIPTEAGIRTTRPSSQPDQVNEEKPTHGPFMVSSENYCLVEPTPYPNHLLSGAGNLFKPINHLELE